MYWLQLVKTPDSHLSGQLEQTLLDESGKVGHVTLVIVGAAVGNSVTFSATAPGLEVVTLSGNVEGERLVVTGGRPSPMIFVRSDLREYQAEVDALNEKVLRIRASEANKEFLTQIGDLIERMQKFGTEADVHLSRFPGAEERLREITAIMSEYVNREHELAGKGQAAVARGQLNVAIHQASIETNQLHNSAQSLESSLNTGLRSMAVETGDLGQRCRNTSLPNLTQAQIQARTAACDRLTHAAGVYKQQFESITRGLVHFEQVYAEERSTQEDLLRSSRRLQ